MNRIMSFTIMFLFACGTALPTNADIYVNEFHYDNVGGDVGEFIEVVTTPGELSADFFEVVLYNGNNGTPYNQFLLTSFVDHGVLSDGNNYFSLTLPANGIQNGSPDGIAIGEFKPGDGNGGSTLLREFISYEGEFVGVGGVANKAMSMDIGAEEPGDALIGSSLQRFDDGFGPVSWVFTNGFNTQGGVNANIPEPTSAALLGVCLLAITARRRKR